jgi:hypothetical protein
MSISVNKIFILPRRSSSFNRYAIIFYKILDSCFASLSRKKIEKIQLLKKIKQYSVKFDIFRKGIEKGFFMKIRKLLVLTALFVAVCCVSAKEKKGVAAKDTTAQCVFMKEVCNEALDFQKIYDATPEGDEKKEMLEALNSYIIHCEKARKDCSKSVK